MTCIPHGNRFRRGKIPGVGHLRLVRSNLFRHGSGALIDSQVDRLLGGMEAQAGVIVCRADKRLKTEVW